MAKNFRYFIFTHAGTIIMQQLPNINIREQAKKQLIDDSLIANVEDFRSQATKAFNDYTVRQRTIIYQLGAKNIDSYGVLTAWQDELLPKQQSLRKKRSDDAFSKLLTKNLLLKNNEIESKVDHIIQERETEILNNFIEKIYPIATDNDSNKYTDQRQQATDLLSKPETEINEILNHYIDYLLYKEIADENHISVNDPHSSPIKRLISNSRIRSERKKTVIYQNERLIFIKNRLELLSKMNGGLVANLYEKKWDLIIRLNGKI